LMHHTFSKLLSSTLMETTATILRKGKFLVPLFISRQLKLKVSSQSPIADSETPKVFMSQGSSFRSDSHFGLPDGFYFNGTIRVVGKIGTRVNMSAAITLINPATSTV
jgi:hypothetical protein